MLNFYMDSLSEDLVRRIHGIMDVQGNFLFLAPVCKQWYNLRTTKTTNLKHMMASSSTIRESAESRGGSETLARKNAWGFLAKHKEIANGLNELNELIEWDEFSVGAAGHHGNLSFMEWVVTTTLKWDSELALSSSALAGKFNFLKHMYNLGYVPGQRSVIGAARAGSVEILKWMNEIGCDMKDVTDALAEEGHLGPLKWANSNGFPCEHKRTLDAAIYGDNYEVINYLTEVNRTRR